LLQEICAERTRDCERRQVAVACALDAADPAVLGEATMLREVFSGLVANSLEAMPDGGGIRLATSLEDRGRRVAVVIEDEGPGLSPTELAQVMRPFHTTKPKGLGLGLPLAKRVVERHGGSLTMSSEPGRGVRVRIVVPVAR
jgi:signal transduction histidine kinase